MSARTQASFLVGYSCHEGLSFTFVCMLWRDNFAEHLLINRSHEPDTSTKFLACYFRRELFWSLNAICGISVDNFVSLLLVSLNLKMADDDSLQDSQRGVPGNIRVPQEDATVATAASVASQGSTAVFQQRARRTLLEIEQDEVVVRKGDRGLPGSKIYVANRIVTTQSLSSKFLGSFHLQSKNVASGLI